MLKLKTYLFKLFRKSYLLLAKTPLRRIPGMATFANLIFRKIWPSNMNIVEIQGSKIYLNISDSNPGLRQTFQAYALKGIHEEATTSIFKKIIKPGDIFLDLGANIGYFSLLAAKLVGEKGKVFSFEPEPRNFYYLQKNIEINNYKNIYPFQKAVSNINDMIELFICDYDSGHHTINQYEGIEVYSHGRPTQKKSIKIEAVKLDDFLKDKTDRVDIVKMDIEGAEALAIEGMKNILKNNKNIKILMEFFPLLIQKMGDSPEKLIKTLIEDLEFNIFVVGRDYSMEKEQKDLTIVNDFNELMSLMKDEEDHLNLYLSREVIFSV